MPWYASNQVSVWYGVETVDSRVVPRLLDRGGKPEVFDEVVSVFLHGVPAWCYICTAGTPESRPRG
ncbi:MAG: hypothetical protein Kow0074_07080 [Candidatus Zixiibacteriota bacterium]